MTPTDTVLTVLLYIAAGWIALLAVQRLQYWHGSRERKALWTGLVYSFGATLAIAYLIWWPLFLVATWQLMELYTARRNRS